MKQPRFYAGKMLPGGYGSLGGIKVNWKLEVLTKDQDVIPGLYAVGVDANSIYADSYIFFLQPESDFSENADVKALLAELKLTLRTAAQARNHLRRTLYGIKKLTDVKIPTRDGAYLPTCGIFTYFPAFLV